MALGTGRGEATAAGRDPRAGRMRSRRPPPAIRPRRSGRCRSRGPSAARPRRPDVRRLQIAVGDPVLVGVPHRVADPDHELEALPLVEPGSRAACGEWASRRSWPERNRGGPIRPLRGSVSAYVHASKGRLVTIGTGIEQAFLDTLQRVTCGEAAKSLFPFLCRDVSHPSGCQNDDGAAPARGPRGLSFRARRTYREHRRRSGPGGASQGAELRGSGVLPAPYRRGLLGAPHLAEREPRSQADAGRRASGRADPGQGRGLLEEIQRARGFLSDGRHSATRRAGSFTPVAGPRRRSSS